MDKEYTLTELRDRTLDLINTSGLAESEKNTFKLLMRMSDKLAEVSERVKQLEAKLGATFIDNGGKNNG